MDDKDTLSKFTSIRENNENYKKTPKFCKDVL